jgi:broad specificity phosphatase PhoE
MQIVLLRHGKPHLPDLGKLRASEMHQWVKSYNAAGLSVEHKPTKEAIEVTNHCSAVVCSDLPRSIETAHALRLSEINYIEPLFREMSLPYAQFPSPKLSPRIWAVLFRIIWFFGFSSNGESLHDAKIRAFNGADRLVEIATDNESVLLVGHGFVNRFIAKELLSRGWRGPANPGRKYWDFGVYEYTT